MKKSNAVVILLLIFCFLCVFTSCVVEAAKCNVIFMVDDEEYHRTEVKAQTTVSLPTAPVKDGFKFAGWYFDNGVWEKEFTNLYFIDNKMGSDVTVFARFIATENLDDSSDLPGSEGEEHTHTEGEPQISEVVEPTCTTEGSYLEEIRCTECDEIISSETKISERLDHTFNDGECECGALKSTDGLLYELNEDSLGYTLTGIGDCKAEKIVVDVYNGLPVTTISPMAFYECTTIKELVIGSSVLYVRDRAFYGCTSLLSVEFSDEQQEISSQAFRGCISLKSVTLPKGIKELGYATFADCSSLSEINLNEGLERIENYVFSGCINLYSITIPRGVKYVDKDAFYECFRLYEIYNCSELDIRVGDFGLEAYGMYPYNVYTPDSGKSKLTVTDKGFVFGEYGKVNYLLGYTGDSDKLSLPISCVGKDYQIHRYAFYNMTGLKSVTIPSRVKGIGDFAFYGCTSLEKLNFNATSIPDFEFQNYVFHEAGKDAEGVEITVGKNVTRIPAYMFFAGMVYTEAKVKSLEFEDGSVCTEIGENAFRETGISKVTIPASMKKIGKYALSGSGTLDVYYDAVSLEDREQYDSLFGGIWADTKSFTLTIGPSVERIPAYAFANTDVMVLNFVEGGVCRDIGSHAFSGCAKLAEINYNIPELRDFGYGLVENDESPFDGAGKTDGETVLNVSASVKKIPNGLFYASNITKVVFEENSECTSIGRRAFSGCNYLTEIEIPDGVKIIDDSAFSYSSALTNISIPSDVFVVSTDAFSGCASLVMNEYSGAFYIGNEENPYMLLIKAKSTEITECEIHPDARIICDFAFDDCTLLTSIQIPDTIESVGDYAFKDCRALSRTDVNGLSYIGSVSNPYFILLDHYDPNLRYVTINSNTKFIHSEALDYTSATTVILPDGLVEIGSFAFCLSNIESISLPSSLKRIGPSAFMGCDNLETVVIPGSLRVLPSYCFDSCEGLETVVISEGVRRIELGAFSYCYNLKTAYIADSVEIMSAAFHYCEKLTNVAFGINSKLKQIEDECFKGCEMLRGFIIPEAVEKIGSDAFLGCKVMKIVINLSQLEITERMKLIEEATVYNKSELGDSLVCTDDGFIFLVSDKAKLIAYASITDEIILPDSFMDGEYTIASYAFYLKPQIRSITISIGVNEIEPYAFDGCDFLSAVSFASVEGWVASSDSERIVFEDDSLDNPYTNVALLRNDYSDYLWTKE